MRFPLLLTLMSFIGHSLFGQVPVADDAASANTPSASQEIETLRAAFNAKRLAAIKPIVDWYRQQLGQRAVSATASDAKTAAAIDAEMKALDQMSIGPDVEKPPTVVASLRSDFMRRADAALQPLFQEYRTQLTQRARDAGARRNPEVALACQNELANLPPPGPGCASLTIIKAMYGAGDKRIDVTKMLAGKNVQHRLHVKGPWKFPDPLFGTPKNLEITYRFLGEIRSHMVGGGQDFSLP